MAVTTKARPESRPTTDKKWVYLFEEGNKDMRDLLGGKGAGVAEMTRAGLPVPPGFTITTEACNAYYASGKRFPDGMWDQAIEAPHHVEDKAGKKLGNVKNPLLVSVRSGAKFSMPGMMDTVLNLGLNPETLEGLAKLTNDRRFALDAYRRFIQMFGKIVLGINAEKFEKRLELAKEKAKVKTDPELKPEQLEMLVKEFKDVILKESGKPFPDEPQEQLRAAIEAVFSSWNNKRAIDYRNFHTISGPRSTCKRWSSATWGTTRARASRSRVTRIPASRSFTATTWRMPRERTSSPASAPRNRSRH